MKFRKFEGDAPLEASVAAATSSGSLYLLASACADVTPFVLGAFLVDVPLEELGECRFVCAGVVNEEAVFAFRLDTRDGRFGFFVRACIEEHVFVSARANANEDGVFALAARRLVALSAQRFDVRVSGLLLLNGNSQSRSGRFLTVTRGVERLRKLAKPRDS
jgi:hypothetical protein